MGVDEETELRPIVRRRWPRMLGAFVLVVAVALAGLWLLRKPLATRYADRFLASKGVPARYGIADLGFGRQRLTNVVLGDPNDPDLVADWLEARTVVGLGGARLTGVRGGHVRLRARLIGGKLTFGSIDRLIPPSDSGKPFALPSLDLDVADARVRLETPFGVAGLKIVGSGRLDGGFAGTVATVAPRLAVAGCTAQQTAAVMRVNLSKRWTIRGPAQAGVVLCAGATVRRPQIALALDTAPTLADWGGRAQLAAATLATSAGRGERLAGTLNFRAQGSAQAGVRGDVALRLGRVATGQVVGGTTTLAGRYWYRSDATGPVLSGYAPTAADPPGMRLSIADLRLPAAPMIAALDTAPLAGTPLAPIAGRLRSAVAAAARSIDLEAGVQGELSRGVTTLKLHRLAARARSGARVDVAPDGEWTFRATRSGAPSAGRSSVYADQASAGALLRGTVSINGGGLPDATIKMNQSRPNAPVDIAVSMQPYAAGPAQLALAGTAARWTPGGAVALRTTATLSGPLGDGRVDGVTLPIDARWDRGRLVVGPGCTPVSWTNVAVAGLQLDRGGVRLCPTGAALVTVVGGRVEGGASLAATRLTGRLGGTPLSLAASGARLRLTDRGFALQGVQAQLGRPQRLTRLNIASLEGRIAQGGLAGRFAGAGGQVGAAPLLLSDAAGSWRVAHGVLSVNGGLTVGDAQADRPRFRPMPVRDVSLTLGAGEVGATGVVVAPGASGRKVADVRLVHRLKQGAGVATFAVPGLLFDKTLQPDALTPVTFGVIANVRGTVTGEGRIAWSDAGVTSTGTFRTKSTDLAAAFGPVEGIAGEIRFTDLLALQSAPGQRVTVRSVNPGMPVLDGVVRLQTLPNARVQVEGARWPLAGGTLTLEPTLLDFAAAAQRRMTFRVDGMAADQFLQQFDFKNLNATGIFDGELPMVFDANGGRIENGRLVVRPGGGQIAYVGPLSQKDIGFWPNIAFQALKSLRYRNLTITVNGPLAGEMVTAVRFAGITQGEGAKRGGIAGLLVGRLQRLPFVFNIRITAPFRGLLDATASFYDPKRLVGRNLPRLLEEQDKRAQPPQGGKKSVPPQGGQKNTLPQGGQRNTPPPAIQPPASRIVP